MNKHILFTKQDVDAPDFIKDQNGDIALELCKVCGKGEVDLQEPCIKQDEVQKFATSQKPLEPEFAKVLNDNIEDLYMTDEKWMPEVGEWCDVIWRCDDSVEQIYPIFISDYVIVFEDTDGEERHVDLENILMFRPIQTTVDRYREGQICILKNILLNAYGFNDIEEGRAKYFAEALVDQGCRVLAPDEFIAKRLTDEQIAQLKKLIYNSGLPLSSIIDAVQNAMLGGEK